MNLKELELELDKITKRHFPEEKSPGFRAEVLDWIVQTKKRDIQNWLAQVEEHVEKNPPCIRGAVRSSEAEAKKEFLKEYWIEFWREALKRRMHE
jgi:hypothetical protein